MDFTYADILQIAARQSAIDANCRQEDFFKSENVVVTSAANPGARKYLSLPLRVNLVSYGNNIVASVSEKYRVAVTGYINRFRPEHCFETPNMHVLNDELQKDGVRICFMAEYFLPDPNALRPLDCPYKTKLLRRKDFFGLYTGRWSNALNKERSELDVLGIGAYDGEKLIGLAACSADCDSMWQIGIDVLSGYRRQGVACALTSRLALEILKMGKVPFYCAAWRNIKSVRNAIKSGFRPAWVEMTAKSASFVRDLNGQRR